MRLPHTHPLPLDLAPRPQQHNGGGEALQGQRPRDPSTPGCGHVSHRILREELSEETDWSALLGAPLPFPLFCLEGQCNTEAQLPFCAHEAPGTAELRDEGRPSEGVGATPFGAVSPQQPWCLGRRGPRVSNCTGSEGPAPRRPGPRGWQSPCSLHRLLRAPLRPPPHSGSSKCRADSFLPCVSSTGDPLP